MQLADLLEERREEILRRWEERVCGELVDGEMPRAVLRDDLPDFLESTAASLRSGAVGAGVARAGEAHGRQRALAGADLRHVLREYGVLRDVVFELLEEADCPSQLEELRIFGAALTSAVGEAGSRVLEASEATLRATLESQQRREEAFRTLADSMSQHAWLAEPDGSIFWFNRRWYEYTGLTREASVGRGWLHALPPDTHVPAGWFGEASRRGEPWEETLSLRGSDGSYRRFLCRAAPVLGPDGRVLHWVGTNTDVEARLRTEEEREKAIALLDTLITTAPVGLAFLDRDFRYVRINRTLAAINGASVEAHLGRTLAEMRPDIADRIQPLLEEVLATGKPLLHLEFTEERPQAVGPQHRLVSIYPVADARGRIFAVGVLVVDITGRKHDEEVLRRTAEFRERFVGIVAHDLKTPLASIAAAAQLLQRQEGMPPAALQLAGRISATANRMGKMTSDLMDFTRVRLGGGIPIEWERCDLAALLRHVVEEAGAAWPDRRIDLDADGTAWGCWDSDRLAQVIANLLQNALAYSPAGSPVRVSLEHGAGLFRLLVCNRNVHGPIPPEKQALLFEPFRRAATATHRSEGLGLGLYIAREIVRAHHGAIEVRSTEEEGTTFVVTLPGDEAFEEQPTG